VTDGAIPTSYDPIGAGIAALVAARPSALPHVDQGRYANVLAGWRAQAALCIARIADEVRSSRLPTAQGDALRALVASEFDIQSNSDGRSTAIGTARISRTGMTAGTLPRGTRFRRVPNPNLSPPIREATYALTEDMFLGSAQSTATLPAQCTQDGSIGNVFFDDGTYTNTVTTPYQFIDPVFDPSIVFVPFGVDMGGGAEITVDDDLRRAARAMAQGRYAPVIAALLAFAYRGYGVRRVAVLDDTFYGIARVAVADGSRNGSALWCSRVKQALYDNNAVGFGCRIDVQPAILVWVAVTATVVLRDSNSQNYTTDISNNVRAALTSYFGDRDDWYSFKTPAVRAVISRADPRILTCASATVTLANGTTQPDVTPWVPDGQHVQSRTFWTLANRGLNVTYVNPS
jgi:hypothetical protein